MRHLLICTSCLQSKWILENFPRTQQPTAVSWARDGKYFCFWTSDPQRAVLQEKKNREEQKHGSVVAQPTLAKFQIRLYEIVSIKKS